MIKKKRNGLGLSDNQFFYPYTVLALFLHDVS